VAQATRHTLSVNGMPVWRLPRTRLRAGGTKDFNISKLSELERKKPNLADPPLFFAAHKLRYDTSLSYFHHANDYWTFKVDKCGSNDVVDLWNWKNNQNFTFPGRPAKSFKNVDQCVLKVPSRLGGSVSTRTRCSRLVSRRLSAIITRRSRCFSSGPPILFTVRPSFSREDFVVSSIS
jgi:hypothetical protein